MATTTTRFSEAVRAKLQQNAINGMKPSTVGELARIMGRGNQGRARTYRRSLFKWMSATGPRPSGTSMAIVADALGIETSSLAEPEEDEEADLRALLSIRDMTLGDVLLALAALKGNGPGTPAKSAPGPSTQEVLTHDGGNDGR